MIVANIPPEQLEAQIKRLRTLATAVQRTEVPNRQIGQEMLNFVFRNFQTEGGMTEAGRWEPLAPTTVAWKEARGYGMILQNEGELRGSFQSMHGPKYAGVGAQKLPPAAKSAAKDAARQRAKGKRDVKVAQRSPDIAAVHEYGLGHVPARPMLPTLGQALGIGMRVYGLYIREHVK